MNEKFKTLKKVFKNIFFISVLILIVLEFRKISKELSFDEVNNIFRKQSFISLIFMAIYGICANLPQVLYDFVFNKEINSDLDKRYIGETAFTINNFNDVLGLGGLISIGLRKTYYGKGRNSSEMIGKIMKLLVFLPTGLGFFSLLSLISLHFHPNEKLENYYILLIGASLYLLFVLGLSILKKIEFSKSSQISLFLISISEWFGVMSSFVVIGLLMGVKFNIFKLAILVVIANIIGYISMIPGSIGSFDLVILLALSSQGIDEELAFTWILLYRIFYYLLPFLIASGFFIKNLSKVFNIKDEKFIRRLTRNILIIVNSVLMYVFGLFMILAATLPSKAYGSGIIARLNPIKASAIYQFPSILFGFIFIIMARAYISRQKKSNILNPIVLSLVLIYTYLTGYSISTMVYILLMLIIWIFTRKGMYTKQFLYANEDRLVDFILTNTMLIIYVGGILKSGSIIDAYIAKNSDFVVVPFEYNFISIVVSISLIYFVVFIIIKYLQGKKIIIGEDFDRDRFVSLCENKGGSKEAFLAFLNDKYLYWYKKDDEDLACLQFRRVSDKLIVMGDPIGDKTFFFNLLDSFINEADDYGYNIVFYEVSKEITLKLHEYGFNFMKFGECARVDLSSFNLDGKKNKNLRKSINKLNREGYVFEIYEKPHKGKFLQQLKKISDSWLDGKKEKGFSLGFFDRTYLNESDIAVVYDRDRNIIAFANLPYGNIENWMTVDLMRYKKDANPDGLMDFLFINIFNYCKQNDIEYFDLGMAPLYNVGVMRHSFLQEKLVYLIFKFGDFFYSFEGLKSYKDKYATKWDERYLSYSRGSSLFFSALSLMYASNRK
ncbi:bifunctional lysylphosphatidylglycerol flippase/synthetase MprF [Anaerococcus porci]|uniref:Phosphatidylglycerol lysyltransferase n=1 Tax=Anaerococcus porci TaxID=2652269 RepID=A0A6N7VW42_9FIRM|nr:bifunctional lysylphosphatidylglycerol flippase/synthetase MprF [Anaerococcus porci]MDY3006828.1 bifunctional lysylphosphatidylglycerol flippase/synthetase MprF [Anaerococcus porci]MSS78283.1 bifunctional lysylphosphatidylglycerol flippase/synthetase MprF [Anaerococcus porci]